MPLFGHNVHVSITPDRAAYVPGDLVLASVVATFGSDAEVKAARVQLIGREHIEHVAGLAPIKAGDAKLGKTGHVPAGTRWEHTCRIRLPPDAPASGTGSLTAVEWRLSATIELGRARDVHLDYPIQVLSPKRRPHVSLDLTLHGTTYECPMELIIHDRDVGAGEIVKAALRIRPMKDLHATSIEACLVMNEVPQTYSSVGQRATEFARTRLAQGGEIQAGYAVEFPIEIPLSYDLVPSRLGTYSEVIWKLKAMAHRRLLNDLWVTTNLNVYNENLIESLPGPSRPSGTRRRTRSSRS